MPKKMFLFCICLLLDCKLANSSSLLKSHMYVCPFKYFLFHTSPDCNYSTAAAKVLLLLLLLLLLIIIIIVSCSVQMKCKIKTKHKEIKTLYFCFTPTNQVIF